MIRHHNSWRTKLFVPPENMPLPVEVGQLTGKRVTQWIQKDPNGKGSFVDNFKQVEKADGPLAFEWKGKTMFGYTPPTPKRVLEPSAEDQAKERGRSRARSSGRGRSRSTPPTAGAAAPEGAPHSKEEAHLAVKTESKAESQPAQGSTEARPEEHEALAVEADMAMVKTESIAESRTAQGSTERPAYGQDRAAAAEGPEYFNMAAGDTPEEGPASRDALKNKTEAFAEVANFYLNEEVGQGPDSQA